VAAPCYVAVGSGMTCHRIRSNVRHIAATTSGFDFNHITTVDSHFAPVCKILSKSDHPQQKNDVMLILKMADLSHLGF